MPSATAAAAVAETPTSKLSASASRATITKRTIAEMLIHVELSYYLILGMHTGARGRQLPARLPALHRLSLG